MISESVLLVSEVIASHGTYPESEHLLKTQDLFRKRERRLRKYSRSNSIGSRRNVEPCEVSDLISGLEMEAP